MGEDAWAGRCRGDGVGPCPSGRRVVLEICFGLACNVVVLAPHPNDRGHRMARAAKKAHEVDTARPE